MKYFLDCEFNGFGGDLISLALVREDGAMFYIVSDFFTRPHGEGIVDPWVAKNVIPILYDSPIRPLVTDDAFAHHVADFLGDDPAPHIISDWPEDIMHICRQLLTGPGMMIRTGTQINFSVVRVDAYPTTLNGAVQHNALWDAVALRHLVQGS